MFVEHLETAWIHLLLGLPRCFDTATHLHYDFRVMRLSHCWYFSVMKRCLRQERSTAPFLGDDAAGEYFPVFITSPITYPCIFLVLMVIGNHPPASINLNCHDSLHLGLVEGCFGYYLLLLFDWRWCRGCWKFTSCRSGDGCTQEKEPINQSSETI